jgi:hypothetical protein
MPNARHLLPAIDRIMLGLLRTWHSDHPGEPNMPAFFGMNVAEFGFFVANGVLPAGYRPPGWRGDDVEVREEAVHVPSRDRTRP